MGIAQRKYSTLLGGAKNYMESESADVTVSFFCPLIVIKRALRAEIWVPALVSGRCDSIIITFSAGKVGGRRLVRSQCYCCTFLELRCLDS